MLLSHTHDRFEHKTLREEILQCFDDLGNRTIGRPRSEVKQKPYRWWYGVSNIWLVNDQAMLLCTKRSEMLAGNPGKWQTYLGGHLPVGLSYRDNAIKELREEVGLTVGSDQLFFVHTRRAEEHKQFIECYALRFNGMPTDLVFCDGEVADAQWLTLAEYHREKDANPEQWCNRCRPEPEAIIIDWMENIRSTG